MMVAVVVKAVNITGFVLVMMLVIEYVHVLTQGRWQERLVRNPWGQLLLASLLGALPGCLGAFLVVGMFAHGLLGLGALVAAMIATSGDEAFVLFAMMPGPALVLTAALVGIGMVAGALTNALVGERRVRCPGLELHKTESCRCLDHGRIQRQLREMTPVRGLLLIVLLLFLGAVLTGRVGPDQWSWMRVTFLLLSVMALTIVATVPEHFLEEHLWRHVVERHLLPLFSWTLGALFLLHLLTRNLELARVVQEQPYTVLVVAGLVGLIPESGPHLVFVTLYADGSIPFAILLASSIVQDGHGMLPLLAHSRPAFVKIKLINLAVGLAVGALVLWADSSG